VILVQSDQLANVWPQVSGWIESAIEYAQGDENALDVLIALARGQYLLFHEPGKFALVGQIQHFPRQKVGTVLYCGGGDLVAIRAAFEEMKPWCKTNGISAIRVWGRQGWERVLGLARKGSILQMSV
jgi:hypothetical protein